MISEYQIKKMNSNETFLAKSRKESSTYDILRFMFNYIKKAMVNLLSIYNTKRGKIKTKFNENKNALA